MNKFFYIASIVLSVVFIVCSAYYANQVSIGRMYYHANNPLLPSYAYNPLLPKSTYASLTKEMGIISLFFFAFFIAAILLGLIKVKTMTNKVFSIIGLCFSLLILAWNLVMMSSPRAISFDEVALVWLFYAFIILAFSIVGLVQTVKFGGKKSDFAAELIDSGI